jgi:hypothetical protein
MDYHKVKHSYVCASWNVWQTVTAVAGVCKKNKQPWSGTFLIIVQKRRVLPLCHRSTPHVTTHTPHTQPNKLNEPWTNSGTASSHHIKDARHMDTSLLFSLNFFTTHIVYRFASLHNCSHQNVRHHTRSLFRCSMWYHRILLTEQPTVFHKARTSNTINIVPFWRMQLNCIHHEGKLQLST